MNDCVDSLRATSNDLLQLFPMHLLLPEDEADNVQVHLALSAGLLHNHLKQKLHPTLRVSLSHQLAQLRIGEQGEESFFEEGIGEVGHVVEDGTILKPFLAREEVFGNIFMALSFRRHLDQQLCPPWLEVDHSQDKPCKTLAQHSIGKVNYSQQFFI
jgi:hypothetical protein